VTDRSHWQAAVARTVEAMGYETVDVERSAGGLLRVTIDRVPGRAYPTGESRAVLIEDCEAMTHQLQYALEVDGVDYQRLEVSSPGLDRPLRKESDIARFVGEAAEVTLKAPLQGRRRFRGLLAARDGGWRLVLDDRVGRPRDPRARPSRRAAGTPQVDTVETLDFEWNEVHEAHLVPVLDFKGRAAKAARNETDPGGLQR
jgi:ribosome maturation factor RimP